MEKLPSRSNSNLPVHTAILANGTPDGIPCAGKKVRDISSDVGLFVGGCSHCCEKFVYVFKTDTWETQKDFDARLRKGLNGIRRELESF